MLRYVAYLILAEEMDLHFPFLRKFFIQIYLA